MTTVHERRFRAMGTDAHVMVVGDEPLVHRAVARIDELEHLWSRFLPDTEVSRLSAASGTWVRVSPETVTLVELAVEAWRATGGAFDPTVLGAVLRAGYDRTFDELTGTAPGSDLVIGASDIEIREGAVRLPPGAGFDPGGIGKGLAADLVVAELLAAGAAGACVNLGGDLRAAGDGPEGAGWTIAIEHPWQRTPIATVGIGDGAVATSTTLKRRWRLPGGRERHHLIDPRTGEPSATDVTLATVVAGEAWRAEVLAKAVLLRGSAHPFDLIEGADAEAMIVVDDGRVLSTRRFTDYLGYGWLPDRIERPPHAER